MARVWFPRKTLQPHLAVKLQHTSLEPAFVVPRLWHVPMASNILITHLHMCRNDLHTHSLDFKRTGALCHPRPNITCEVAREVQARNKRSHQHCLLTLGPMGLCSYSAKASLVFFIR